MSVPKEQGVYERFENQTVFFKIWSVKNICMFDLKIGMGKRYQKWKYVFANSGGGEAVASKGFSREVLSILE